MRSVVAVPLLGVVLALTSQAAETKAVKLTVQVSGVVDDETAAVLRKRLEKVPGIKGNLDDLQAGPADGFKNYFSPKFVVELTDLSKTDLGAVAKAVAEAKTPKKSERGTGLYLVLFHPAIKVGEAEVSTVREALANVNGMDVRSVGGTGGAPSEGLLWVRLHANGEAKLEDVQAALKKADIDLRLEKP